jgi:hypothetical protein
MKTCRFAPASRVLAQTANQWILGGGRRWFQRMQLLGGAASANKR